MIQYLTSQYTINTFILNSVPLTPNKVLSAPSLTACIVAHTSSNMLMMPGGCLPSISSHTILLLKYSIGFHLIPSCTYSSCKHETSTKTVFVSQHRCSDITKLDKVEQMVIHNKLIYRRPGIIPEMKRENGPLFYNRPTCSAFRVSSMKICWSFSFT